MEEEHQRRIKVHMSLIKALMRAITAMSRVVGGSVDDEIGKLEIVFQDKEDGGKQRLINLVDILKRQGTWPQRHLVGLVGIG
jgi:hypothetical protein